jgi:hypothetical protein
MTINVSVSGPRNVSENKERNSSNESPDLFGHHHQKKDEKNGIPLANWPDCQSETGYSVGLCIER